MNEHDLREEYNRLRDNGTLANMLGAVCVNCGEKDNIEYHHIVPLHLGGTNRLSNIVPLCNRCHKVAHNGRHIKEFRNGKINGGRNSNVSDRVAFKALDKWADGQIGNRKCSEMMKIAQHTVIASVQYKKWCAVRGYKKVRNTLDIAATNSRRPFNERLVVGQIEMPDSSIRLIYFHDTGLNDNVVYARREGGSYRFSDIKTMNVDRRIPEFKAIGQDLDGQFRFA